MRYFKDDLIKYDQTNDSYYWSYWKCSGGEVWEDISHAALTVYGIHILHHEADFTVFDENDFVRFSNIVTKVIDDGRTPMVSKYIHPREGMDGEFYFTEMDNPYYFEIGRWAFLARYNPRILGDLEACFNHLYQYELPEETMQSRLYQISNYIYAMKETN